MPSGKPIKVEIVDGPQGRFIVRAYSDGKKEREPVVQLPGNKRFRPRPCRQWDLSRTKKKERWHPGIGDRGQASRGSRRDAEEVGAGERRRSRRRAFALGKARRDNVCSLSQTLAISQANHGAGELWLCALFIRG